MATPPKKRRVEPPVTMNQQDAAAYLEVTPRTLRNWAASGHGPPFAKIGNRVRYKLDDLTAWLAKRLLQPEKRRKRRRRAKP